MIPPDINAIVDSLVMAHGFNLIINNPEQRPVAITRSSITCQTPYSLRRTTLLFNSVMLGKVKP